MNSNIQKQVEEAYATESTIDPWRGILVSDLANFRSLSNSEVNGIQNRVRNKLVTTLGVELR
jgi:hypothetical protein